MPRRNKYLYLAAAFLLTAALTAGCLHLIGQNNTVRLWLEKTFSDEKTITFLFAPERHLLALRTSFTNLFHEMQEPNTQSQSGQTEDSAIPEAPDQPATDSPEIYDTFTEPDIKSPEEFEASQKQPLQDEISDLFLEPLDASLVSIRNGTDYSVDIQAMLEDPPELKPLSGKPSVLILHTHTTESYTPDGTYQESDPYRTLNQAHSVVAIGDVLEQRLNSAGIGVIHDKQTYDYPDYNGAYNRALSTIENYLTKYPSICMVIDIHRDAISDTDGKQYKTVAQIGEDTCSQVLLVMGTDSAGLPHPNWRENLKLAVRLQYAMNQLYPTLAKPINLTKYRYNEHASPGSILLEVGCTGNTFEESVKAVDYFADALLAVLESGKE